MPERPLEYRDEPAQPYWPTFVEKLLLAVIDANPPDERAPIERAADKDRQKRLEAALKALFGVSRKKGPKRNYALHAAVEAAKRYATNESMAAFEETILHWPKSERTVVPSKASAFRASDGLIEGNSQPSRQERIEDFQSAHASYVHHVANGHSHFEEEDMLRDLFIIGRVLKRWNIQLAADAEALGMASLWGVEAGQITPERSSKSTDI